ncbi:MAG: HD domain-containing phosphohydrolase [Bacillota bacterium]
MILTNKKYLVIYNLIIISLFVINKVFSLISFNFLFIIFFVITSIALILVLKNKVNELDNKKELINKNIEMLLEENKDKLKKLKNYNEFVKETEEIYKKYDKLDNLFYQILNNSNQLIFVKNSNLEFEYVNKKFLDYFNIESQNIIGKDNKYLINKFKDKLDYSIEDDQALLNKSKKIVKKIVSFEDFFGKKRYFEQEKILINYKSQKKILGYATDITRRVENKKKYEKHIEKLEQSILEKNELNVKLNKLIDLFIEIHISNYQNINDLLIKVFDLSYRLIKESDCGVLYIYKNGKFKFLKVYGYNKEKLNNLEINEDKFLDYFNPLIVKSNLKKDKKHFKVKDDKIKESMRIPIKDKNEFLGGISLDINKGSESSFDKESRYLMGILDKLLFIIVSIFNSKIKETKYQRNIIKGLLNILVIHDEYTNDHSENVANLAKKLAKRLKLSEEQVNKAYWAGITHDIGKIEVPSGILNKVSRLTDDEYEKIKKHPFYGYKALSNVKGLSDISKYVLYHHERLDGKGYPEGLTKKDIPYISKILSVVDAWDAMTSERSYRKPLDKKIAKKELINNSGKQFDTFIVDTFIEMLKEGDKL